MSYDEHDAAMDEMYERIGEELYPEHRVQAIGLFTAERLSSYYQSNPMVMRPAVNALQEAKRLSANGHSSATVVFCVTTVELLLKATLLQPIVYGLVHNDGLAEIIVKYALGETGFDRYRNLLSRAGCTARNMLSSQPISWIASSSIVGRILGTDCACAYGRTTSIID